MWRKLPEIVFGACERWVSKNDNKLTVEWESDASSSTEYLEVCSTLITSPQPSPSPSPQPSPYPLTPTFTLPPHPNLHPTP